MSAPSLKSYAWLSIAAALATIVLKSLAWWLTGSVGLLSDALESVVNLAGAMMALAMISLAEQPADEKHAYGHNKAEYFSGGFEGLLIVIAAVGIAVAAIDRLLHPQPLASLDTGLVISALASLINLVVARILLAAARRHRSLPLEADARHLMTDVWTSVAVIAGTHCSGELYPVESSVSTGASMSTPAAIVRCPAMTAASHPGWVGKPRSGRQPSGLSGRVPSSRWARV